MQMQLKETMEMLEAIKMLAVQAKKVMADGKVSVADLPVLMETLKQAGMMTDAIQGADQITGEFKDLSSEEAQQVVAKVYEIAAAFKAA